MFPWVITYLCDLRNIIYGLKTSSLTSRRTLHDGIQEPLPDNQWQLEVEYWHNIMLVSLQGITNAAIGVDNPEILKYFWIRPESGTHVKLCKNQVRLLISLYLRPQVAGSRVTFGSVFTMLDCVWNSCDLALG